MDLQMTATLAETLDRCNLAFFEGQPLTALERYELVREIAANLEREETDGLRLFTGEHVRTRFAMNAITCEESARAMILLDSPTVDGVMALEEARQRLVGKCFTDGCTLGECAQAAVGWLRYLAVTDFADTQRRLEAGLKMVNGLRDGLGRWKGLPFYYTLLMLSEQDSPDARRELRYAASTCERLLSMQAPDDVYGQRRRAVLERVLCLC
ncbi:hypothetical protein LARV_03316 [Longilinea arvoryzae]|uniref:Uncharacterized protein n=1 Tax=Longilinea arvoryzae TaxID=360412 RepID=A0A0S7BLY7_9CHLR|nr:hypothetical protein [Longilinea arvoryzae]GAP15526.1 hypothetical protein LARV_03316 [Longilinea arvoryzae]